VKAWHFRFARVIIYIGAVVAAVVVAVVSVMDAPDAGQALVGARQLYGLWALGLMLAAMLIGPLTSVLPWFPFKVSLMYGRRAVGVCVLLFAALHVGCYLWSVARRNWRELYTPGTLWVAGLVLGLLALSDMIALGFTSRDAAVKKMGGRRWKRLHRTVYAALAVVLTHAVLVGADFGVNRGPDVTAAPDAGALIGFLCLSAASLILFVLRHQGVRWTPRFLTPRAASA